MNKYIIIVVCILIIIIIGIIVKYKYNIGSKKLIENYQGLLGGYNSRPQKIPYHIYQTNFSHAVNEEDYKIIKKNIKVNPEYSYTLYDDIEQREFLINYFPKRIIDAYDKVKPTAFKADLWRYCILYIHGGIYMDVPMECMVPFDQIISPEDEFVSARDTVASGKAVFNAFIACTPKNIIMKKCIDKCLDHIENNYFDINSPEFCLSITGPGMVGDILYELNPHLDKNKDLPLKNDKGVPFKLLDHSSVGYLFDENYKLLLHKYYWLTKFITFQTNGRMHYTYNCILSKIFKDPGFIYHT
jgi:hypothetical protein